MVECELFNGFKETSIKQEFWRKGFSGRPTTVCTKENHGGVLQQQVLQSPKRSPMRAPLKMNISNTSMRRMFKNIGGFPLQDTN
ncbi:hypothetical protein J6590_016699 [Homalodisca vitripennis]|nr:hypothetical protein J6590_016699 [Homalodisca vitripennis]